MKKAIVCLFALFMGYSSFGQEASEGSEIQNVIETFFEGFHAKDSIIMKSVLAEGVIVQTVGKSKSGEIKLHNEEISEVLKNIVSIPSETTFKEVIHSYDIRIDGAMANAWTPYSFFLNDGFSHCGVNNFQLFKKDNKWKIIYLIDTRRREGCEDIAKK
ncbi:nuclear transport factor 2 family protein [Salinimicrobium gaetbulicola]|uniref:Nuclear transport factor 2 family protein n=1 Tax=Salinimicrobium gaetbulicola TaxID=999702 RepID=A0ABW3IDY2_9FLAO